MHERSDWPGQEFMRPNSLHICVQVAVQVRPGLLPGWMQCFFRVTGSRGWRVCLHFNTIRSRLFARTCAPKSTLQDPLSAHTPRPRAGKFGCILTSLRTSRIGGLTKASLLVGLQTREVSLPADCMHHATVSLQPSHVRDLDIQTRQHRKTKDNQTAFRAGK